MHHDIQTFLLALAVLLGSARLLGAGARRLGFPAVVGEILAGILVGKTLLGRLAPDAFAWLFPAGDAKTLLEGYTTVAVMLLMVVAGMEVDLRVVGRSGRTALNIAALGAVIPFALGYGMGLVLPDSDLADPSRRLLHAAFLGIALAISALPVIARTLLDLGLLKTDLGLMILTAAVVDDLAGWIGFTVLSHQFHGGQSGPSVGVSLLLTAAFVAGTLLLGRPLVDRLLARWQRPGDTTSVLSMVMLLALCGAAATQALGLHAVFGGFVVGVAMGDSKRLREHTRTVLGDFVSSVFTPVFFATIALRFDVVAHFDVRLVAIVLAIACVAKVAGCMLGARLGGIGWRESAAIGFGMSSRGAMGILLATLALEVGIINTRLFVALVLMAVVTSLVSGPAMSCLLRPAPLPVRQLLARGAVLLDVPGETREEILRALAGALAARLGRPADAERFAAAVRAREELAGTGVGDGVAIPHAEVDGLRSPALALARTEHDIDFDAPDGVRVRLVFLLLMPPREFDRELQILSGIVRLVMNGELRHRLLEAGDAAAALAIIEVAERAAASSARNR